MPAAPVSPTASSSFNDIIASADGSNTSSTEEVEDVMVPEKPASVVRHRRVLLSLMVLLLVALVAGALGLAFSPRVGGRLRGSSDDAAAANSSSTDDPQDSIVVSDPEALDEEQQDQQQPPAPQVIVSWQNRSWTELVGLPAPQAAAVILEETNHGVEIVVLPYNALYTADYNVRRVRLFVNANHQVVRPPRAG